MVECITNTIVINLGSEGNSDKLAADENLQASTTNQLDNNMEKRTLVDDHNPNVRTDNIVCDLLRNTAIQMKNRKQKHNALKAIKQCGTASMKSAWSPVKGVQVVKHAIPIANSCPQ